MLEKIVANLTFKYHLPLETTDSTLSEPPITDSHQKAHSGGVSEEESTMDGTCDTLVFESRLTQAVLSGDKHSALQELDRILSHHVSAVCPWQQTSARLTELLVLISRAAIQGGIKPSEVLKLNPVLLRQLPALRSPNEIKHWFDELVARLSDQICDLRATHYSATIQKAIHYIEANHPGRMSLNETAAHVYLSPAYFSRLFKAETGTNFCEYLNQVRIERAKQQLVSSQVSLKDLADQLGFDGQSYFSKVFKKKTGLTPARYRESSGRLRPLAAS